MADFELVVGDDNSLSVSLAVDGVAFDLSAASLVDRVEARICRGGAPVVIVATITDAAAGKVRLDIASGLLIVANYTVDWVVVFLDASTRTFQDNSAGAQYSLAVVDRC